MNSISTTPVPWLLLRFLRPCWGRSGKGLDRHNNIPNILVCPASTAHPTNFRLHPSSWPRPLARQTIALKGNALYCTTRHCALLHYSALRRAALHCTAVQSTALHRRRLTHTTNFIGNLTSERQPKEKKDFSLFKEQVAWNWSWSKYKGVWGEPYSKFLFGLK